MGRKEQRECMECKEQQMSMEYMKCRECKEHDEGWEDSLKVCIYNEELAYFPSLHFLLILIKLKIIEQLIQ